MILRRVFERKAIGFYVDVGAHHPKRFSNTYYFYKLGWSGVNIDAIPATMSLFNRLRPRDLNVEAAVGMGSRKVTLSIFNDLALSTFNEELARKRDTPPYAIVQKQTMTVRSLAEILAQYFPHGRDIDFLSVDVEGMDLEVLESNDWELFCPDCVLVESLELSLTGIHNCSVFRFLSQKGYDAFAKTLNTLIFRRNSRG
jgi:FkbM family methyltransferase